MTKQERKAQLVASIACIGCKAKLGQKKIYQNGKIYICADRLKTGTC
jgi:hypothetical protein